ncbi:MAG: hypothetical protein MR842_00965 [Clostridiales bacterium]|nr:hypothetical protein [Clostridiales bacterium]MDO4350243.1 hypothetical protein [Eubacteriales bacterium]MDY4009809.1 hypothetical protein [Candidatus Limiplasma sp.]
MKKKAETIAEWVLLILMVGTIMGMGAARMHQLYLNGFLVAGYAALAVVMFLYRLAYCRWFAKEQGGEG